MAQVCSHKGLQRFCANPVHIQVPGRGLAKSKSRKTKSRKNCFYFKEMPLHQFSLSLGSEGQMPPYAYSCLHSFCSGLSESWLWTYLHTFLLLSTWQLKSLLNTWKTYKNLPHGNGSHTSPAEILCSVPLWWQRCQQLHSHNFLLYPG